jgi:hypothetical protein
MWFLHGRSPNAQRDQDGSEEQHRNGEKSHGCTDRRRIRHQSREQAKEIGSVADGVIGGSAIVKIIEKYGEGAGPYLMSM